MAVPVSVIANKGPYTDALVKESVFIGTVGVAGIALITTATTGGHPTLWNPSGSGVNLSIISLELTQVDGTNAPTAFGWYKTAGAGSAVATGGPIATFTEVAPVAAFVGSPTGSKAKWAPATNTFTVAPAFYAPIPLTLYTAAVNSAIDGVVFKIFYNGALGIAPNAALSICSVAATTTSKFIVAVTWEEVPI